MKKKRSPQAAQSNLPVSKQTAGGVAGAIVGSALAGPVGAVVGGIAGTIMGTRSAKGKSLVSAATVKTAKTAARVVKEKIPALKAKLVPSTPRKTKLAAKSVRAKKVAAAASKKSKPAGAARKTATSKKTVAPKRK